MAPKSCNFCVKRKLRCNRQQPCESCLHFGQRCVYPNQNGKKRPVNRARVEALEGQIASLKNFISQLVVADTNQRNEMLSLFEHNSKAEPSDVSHTVPSQNEAATNGNTLENAYSVRDGKRYDATASFPGIFHGGTVSEAQIPSKATNCSYKEGDCDIVTQGFTGGIPIFDPYSPYCQSSMVLFFDEMYTSYMVLYREYFLRDYDRGGGPYYSELLMYAICAMGGLIGTSQQRGLSEFFARRCEELLFGSEIERASLTALQALLLMGCRAIGRGKSSKGWIFTRMAFGMIHEMGLHLDPEYWKVETGSKLEWEIFRRVYWAAFVIDKQFSLYFGRPPALEPREADVRATTRIPYPNEWNGLLQKYIHPNTTAEIYERGPELIEAFAQKAELCQIIHQMWRRIFARHCPPLSAIAHEAQVAEIRANLERWRDDLPAELQWTKSTKKEVPSYTVQLHMLFHTSIMVLHRPQVAQDPCQASEDYKNKLRICHESVEAVMALVKANGKQHKQLPANFVHTAATTASVLLAEREISSSEQSRTEYEEQLNKLVDALNHVVPIWTSAQVVRDAIHTWTSRPVAGESLTQAPDYESFTNYMDLDQYLDIDDLGYLDVENDLVDFDWLDLDLDLGPS